MSPRVYPLFKQALERADSNVSLDENTTTDGIYVTLLGSGYVYSDSHQFYPDISPAIVSTSDQRITNANVNSNAILDGDDVEFPGISSTVRSLAIYRRNAGANTTWRLVYFYDGLNLAPAATAVGLNWNSQGIYRL